MGVNVGLQSENKCNCTVSAKSLVAIGYYKFFSNTNVRAYNATTNYTGPFIFWEGFTYQNLESQTGKITLKATSPPGGRVSGYLTYPVGLPPEPEGRVWLHDKPLD